jgi:serine/threonine protein kinase
VVDDRRIEALLEEIMDSGRSPEDVCGASPELLPAVRERLRRLRDFAGEVEAMFPRHGPVELDATAIHDQLPEIPGYVVLSLLGRGGIGVVYRARDLGLDRDVAVKLLQDTHSTDSPNSRRFVDEARITAQLQHPGIPAVHELGALPNGRRFLAMKLINGNTLDQLLSARSNPSDGRGRFVAAFEQVCQAVGYAHAQNVIHRDLKPSNVMVGAFGEVQVMDWGLAKLMTKRDGARVAGEPDLGAVPVESIRLSGDARQETQRHDLLGTPAFMPPEQASGAIDRVDARSDVYSLGGILCVILTGKPPFVARTPEAIRLMAAQARLADAHARLDACGAEPELVALCLRCLSPEPDDRPRNAGEVAAAVAALRSQAEERARRAELDRVRAGEQGKRRRVMLAASTALSLVLLACLSVSLWQTRRAEQERDDKDRALAGEQKARELTMFALRDLTDDVVEYQLARDTQLSDENKEFLRKIIEHFESFADITADDAASRAIRAEGQARVAIMRYRLGELSDAESAYRTALGLRVQLAADFPDRPEFRADLASIHNNLGILLRDTGRLKQAEAAHRTALDIGAKLAAEFPNRSEFRDDLARGHNGLGNLLLSSGQLKAAEAAYRSSLDLLEQLVADVPDRPQLHEQLATGYNNLGNVLGDTGRLKEAESAYATALQLQEQLTRDFPSRVQFRLQLARSQNNLSVLFQSMGRAKEAEAASRAALAIRAQLAADFPTRPEFRQELASSHNNLGNTLADTGRIGEAEAAWSAALKLLERLAEDFPTRPEFRQELAKTHGNLGILFRATGRTKEAEAAYGSALELLTQLTTESPGRPEFRSLLARTHNSLGSLFGSTNRARAAEAAFDAAVQVQKQLADDFPTRPEFRQDLARSYSNLGLLLSGMERSEEAEVAHIAALSIRKQLAAELPDQADMRNDVAATAVNLAIVCNERGEFQAAKLYLDEARPHHLAALAANARHPNYRQCYRNYLSALVRANAGLRDRESALQAATTIRDLGWDSPRNTVDAACALAQCIPVAAEHVGANAAEREEAAAFFGDAAMGHLRDAVSKGFDDVARLNQDTELDRLRSRDDFRTLVAELEAKSK